jgi:hypothetical protein
LGLLSVALAGAAYGNVELVKDGRPVADIVVDTNALSSVKLAAADLQKHLELMSGAKLAIVGAPSDGVKNHVYVGENEFTRKLGATVDDLKAEGFKIIAKDNHVVLIGRDEQRRPFPYARAAGLKAWQEFAGEPYSVPGVDPGALNGKLGFLTMDATATLYATSEFLEQLGVRWYAPYEDGTVIPQKKTVVVAEQTLKKEPRFPYREFCFYGAMRSDAEGVLWFKRMKYGASYVYHNNHTTWDILGQPEQRQLHPEYYAMANGRPIAGMGGRGTPRLSDPAFRKSSVNYMNKVLDAYPPLLTASLGMPDGFTQIDERDNAIWGRPGASQQSKFSDYVWDYWLYAAKELKKTHPDKYLACLAYSTYKEPPAGIEKLPDNVAITLCYNTAAMATPQGQAVVTVRDRWLSMLTSKKLYIWDYYLYYSPEGATRYPVFFTKLLQQEMQALNGVCEGKFIEIAPWYPKSGARLVCPGLTHMLHYWQGKLYWDPDMDRQAMLDEYYRLYFGPASAEMKEFYEFAEAVWMRPESRSLSMFSGFLKEPDVDRYFEILHRARAKAGAGTVHDRRIAQIESEMQPVKTLLANLKRTGPDFRGQVSATPFVADGNLEKPFWQGTNLWYAMRELSSGEAMPSDRATQVAFRLTPDRSTLVVGVKCGEPAMDKIIAKAKYHDDFDIFEDDVIELYLETPERSYFKIVVNPAGQVWDETQDVTLVARDTLPALWNPGTQAIVKKVRDGWTAEIVIPTVDFGAQGPDRARPWGINVCRTRTAGGPHELSAISPTGKPMFMDLSKLGNLSMDRVD